MCALPQLKKNRDNGIVSHEYRSQLGEAPTNEIWASKETSNYK